MKMLEARLEQRGQGGFTLIELLVVIAILAVLGGAVIIGIGAMRDTAEEQVCKTNKETIETAAEAQKVTTGDTDYADVATLVSEGYLKDESIDDAHWSVDSGTGEASAIGGDCDGVL